MKTDGIIFDVDGTLWDATQRIAEAYTVILEREKIEGKVITADMLASVMGLLNEDIAARLFPELSCESGCDLSKPAVNSNVSICESMAVGCIPMLRILWKSCQRGIHCI